MYKTYNDIPDYGKSVIKRLIDIGALEVCKDGSINITEDMLRIFVILARIGII
jgi:hypothetical protein